MNNYVQLCGEVAAPPRFSHQSREAVYYIFPLEVARLSGAKDVLNILARKEQLEALELGPLPKLMVTGELRSFNNKTGAGNRLVITVFARQMQLGQGPDENQVFLRGTLCKTPNLRKTPMGREICDLLIATARRYGRSDYLPCITWGQKAIEATSWTVGDMVELEGRIQSRTYIKQEEGQTFEKTAFELSVIGQKKLLLPPGVVEI